MEVVGPTISHFDRAGPCGAPVPGDDGFSLGVLYRGDRDMIAHRAQQKFTLAEIERGDQHNARCHH